MVFKLSSILGLPVFQASTPCLANSHGKDRDSVSLEFVTYVEESHVLHTDC